MTHNMQTDYLYPDPTKVDFDVFGGTLKINNSDDELKEIIQQEYRELQEDPTWNMVASMFVTDQQETFFLTPAETLIFKSIFQRLHPRMLIVSSTQYGKTITIAMALLARIAVFPEDWLVIVPDSKRGKLLINYIIKATSENAYFKGKLTGVRNKSRDAMNRLLEEKSKVKLTYQILSEDNVARYGSVEIVSCEAHRVNEAINAVMGFGGRNVVSDESSLISNEIEAGVFRMLAGKGEDTCYVKIGNPFARNHFYQSFKDTKYKKIFIDERIGLADGQYNKPFLEEAAERPLYSILFQCKFPEEEAVDADGYSPLVLEENLNKALKPQVQLFGELRLGIDSAGEGRDYSTLVLRGSNAAKVLWRKRTIDTMLIYSQACHFIDAFNIDPRNVFVDAIGIGKGVYDRLAQTYKGIVSVKGSNSPERSKDSQDFKNARAQMHWRAALALTAGMELEHDRSWEEVLQVKYSTEKGILQIMSKKEMRKRRIKSPDTWDAFALTFARETIVRPRADDAEKNFMKQMKAKRRKRVSKSFRKVPY